MHSFTTERLLIRPLAEQDKAFYCQQFSNEKVMRHTGGVLSQEEANKAFQRSLRANQRAINGGDKTLLTWAIVCLKQERTIGTQSLSFLIRPHNKAIMQQAASEAAQQTEIGIMLSPKANGKLFPEEAMGALMEYAFSQLNINRINAFYHSKNLGTQRFVNKLGFSAFNELSEQNNAKDTHHQYFDAENWQQQLINKVYPLPAKPD